MTIDKAIEILGAIVLTIDPDRPPDDEDALKLAVEALIEVRRARRLGPPVKEWRLPGETVE